MPNSQSKAKCNATPKVLPSIEVKITWQIEAAITNEDSLTTKCLPTETGIASSQNRKEEALTNVETADLSGPSVHIRDAFFSEGMAQIQWWSFGFRHLAGANRVTQALVGHLHSSTPCLAVIKDHPGATITPSPQPQRDLQPCNSWQMNINIF